MSLCRYIFHSLLAAAATSVASQDAAALGPSAMPSRLAQCLGYGYGPGHHAPIVRTPGVHPDHVPRYTRIPRSTGELYPAPYAPIGCYGEACYQYPAAAAMTLPAPVMAPAAAIGTEPTMAPPPVIAPETSERQARRF